MTADLRRGTATVHLRLRGTFGEEELTALRQQLAACLTSGVTEIRVHVDEQDDLELPVLQALAGVAHHLGRRGGALRVLGASARVRSRIAVHELEQLLVPDDLTVLPAATPARRDQGRAR